MSTKVLVLVNAAWNIVNFRAQLIRRLLAAGYEVVAAAPADGYADAVQALGCRFVSLPMDSGGTSVVRDAALLLRCVELFRREAPDIILSYTVKPNIYGSLAARVVGIPIVNSIEGLGATFIRPGWLTRIVRVLYRIALSRSRVVFFLNPDDRNELVGSRLVRSEQARMIPGAGIDLAHYRPAIDPHAPAAEPAVQGCVFLLVSRMLFDKGIAEYVEAARIVTARYTGTRFQLLGFLDVENPAAISREQMNRWVDEGVVEYLGQTDDVRPFLAAADCVVLPSYREGLPRTLLEAAAMAKPIVATDVPGCREVVADGSSGLLCRVRDAADLAAKLSRIVELGPVERRAMGERGRLKAAREFDERLVVQRYLATISEILSSRDSAAANLETDE